MNSQSSGLFTTKVFSLQSKFHSSDTQFTAPAQNRCYSNPIEYTKTSSKMESSNTRPDNQLESWQYNERQSNLVPAHQQPVQLVPTQFPILPIVMPQHIAQAPPDPRLLDETKSNIFRGIISDRGDSVALQSQYFTQRRKNHELPQGPAHDPNEDFPTNVSPRQKVLVGQIFDAIRNKTGLLNGRPVHDDQGQLALDGSGNVLRKPDANTKRVDELADVKVEMLCWDILVSLQVTSLSGRAFMY